MLKAFCVRLKVSAGYCGAFIASRVANIRMLLVQAGMWEDRALNVVDFDGNANMTVSTHAALAAGFLPHDKRLPPSQRRWWGCVGCRMLSVLVQKAHCWKVMNGVSMTAQNYARAFICISSVFAAPFFLHWWAVAFDAAAIVPFAAAEQVSRWRGT
jgi:hypothetical protein